MISSSFKCRGRITETEVIKECGNHARTLITVIPDDMRNIDSMLSFAKIGENVEVSLDDSLIMCGTVYDISGAIKYTGAAVRLEVVSDSSEADTTKASRIYQSTKKNIQTIFDKLSNDRYKITFKGDTSSKLIEDIVIQNNETDFEFVSRIAAYFDLKVFVCSDERGICNIIVSDALSNMIRLDEKKILAFSAEFDQYHEILDIEYSDYIELGTQVTLNGNNYVVVRVRAIRKDDNDRFFYRMENQKIAQNTNSHSTNLISVGKAKVTDNRDPENLGRIQVDFLDVEDILNDTKAWIKYINLFTANSGGIIMIPDIDEYVEVLCQNNECFAYGCVREQKISDKVNDPEDKSVLLFDRMLSNTKEALLFETEKYSAKLNDNEAYFKNDNCCIRIKPDKFILENKSSVIQVGTDKLHIAVNDSGCIEVSDDSILSRTSNSKFKLDASKAELKVNRFDVK